MTESQCAPATRTRKPAPKPTREVKVLNGPSAADTASLICITLLRGKKVVRADLELYFVTPIASDFGRAFMLDKSSTSPDGGVEGMNHYCCCLNGTESTCECMGFLAHGHCKHIESLAELVAAGLL